MPGLFGLVAVDPRKIVSQEQAKHILQNMADKLQHQAFYKTDTWQDSQGRAAIGRIGHPHLITDSSPLGALGEPATESLYYGTIQSVVQKFDHSPPLDNDPRLGFVNSVGTFSGISLLEDRTRISLVVDRRASEPIYFLINNGVLYFAPEVKALLEYKPDEGSADPGALASMLTSGHLLPHQTLFSNIRKIPSCHALLIENGRTEIREYWRYRPGMEPHTDSRPELASQLASLVSDSVSDSFESIDETMTFLSGGLDSRYILACLADLTPNTSKRLHAVTWGEQRTDDDGDPRIAEQVANSIGRIDHTFIKREVGQFGGWFREVNYLLDGLSEISVFHPHEYQIMKSLRHQGYNRVIRGDEAFGYLGKRFSTDSALSTIGIKPFGMVPHLPELVRPQWYRQMEEASRNDLAAIKDRFHGIEPTTLKDVAYFSLRVPTYLSQASYYKQILFDQRNPLLSNRLLDFYQGIPNALRRNKILFFEAFNLAYPDLAKIPYAKGGGLENWAAIMAGATPLHDFVKSELEDAASGIWEIFDRQQAISMFIALGKSQSRGSTNPRAKNLRSAARKVADYAFPAKVDAMMARRSQQRLPAVTVLLRLLVIKDWYDRFFSQRFGEPKKPAGE